MIRVRSIFGEARMLSGRIRRALGVLPLPAKGRLRPSSTGYAGEGTLRRGLHIVFSGVLAASFAHSASAQTPPSAQPRITIGFVEIDGDPRHEPLKAYERLVLKTREHPYAGAQVG